MVGGEALDNCVFSPRANSAARMSPSAYIPSVSVESVVCKRELIIARMSRKYQFHWNMSANSMIVDWLDLLVRPLE
jgi:hypothetical protein